LTLRDLGKYVLASLVALAITLGVVVYIATRKPAPGRELAFPPEIRVLVENREPLLVVRVTGFKNNSYIPVNYTCDGASAQPGLIVENIPVNASALAIVVYDPDAPSGLFIHWLVYDILVNVTSIKIPESSRVPGRVALNDFGERGYGGPCPPRGDKPHRYVFLVLALDKPIGVDMNDPRKALSSLASHVLCYGIYVGLYKR